MHFCIWKISFNLDCCHILDRITENARFSLSLYFDSISSMMQMLLLCPSLYLCLQDCSFWQPFQAAVFCTCCTFCTCFLYFLFLPFALQCVILTPWACIPPMEVRPHSDSTPLVTGPITAGLSQFGSFSRFLFISDVLPSHTPVPSSGAWWQPSVESLLGHSPPSFGMICLWINPRWSVTCPTTAQKVSGSVNLPTDLPGSWAITKLILAFQRMCVAIIKCDCRRMKPELPILHCRTWFSFC